MPTQEKYLPSPNLMVGEVIHDTAGLKITPLVPHDLSLRALLTARSIGGSLNMQLFDTKETPETKTHPEKKMVS